MPGQVRSRPDDEGELGQLRGLEDGRADRHPAPSAVHALAEKEHTDEQGKADEDDSRGGRPQAPVAPARAQDHRPEAEQRIERLALQVVGGVAAVHRRRRRGRRVDHDEAERKERQGDEDEQIRLELASLHSVKFCTSLLNSSPRRSKFSNWS